MIGIRCVLPRSVADPSQDVDSNEEEESRGADMRTLLAQASSTGAGAHMILKGDAELEAESVRVMWRG